MVDRGGDVVCDCGGDFVCDGMSGGEDSGKVVPFYLEIFIL